MKTSTGERIEIDPKHLYQRLLIMGVGEIPLVDLLQYELCSFPASLFDNQLFIRRRDKAELIHHLVKLVPECIISSLPKGLQYGIDGGGHIHKFLWPKHSTCAEICAMYMQHITGSYDIALSVFDGYHGPSTKDEAHRKEQATMLALRCQSSSKSDIEKEGERALLVMYGCATASSLSSARFDRCQAKVATSAGYVPPEKLPPTVDAGRFHSLRTYHQVQTWRGNILPPENWGWSASPSGMVPFKMSKEAASEQLLRTIRFSCGGKCDRKSCTCLKNGLLCTTACGQCKGVSCLNVQVDSSDSKDIDADDDAAD